MARRSGGGRKWQNNTCQGILVEILQFSIYMYMGEYTVEKWRRNLASWIKHFFFFFCDELPNLGSI